MFEIAPVIVIIGVSGLCLVGALVGLFSGVLVSLILKVRLRGTWKDALLGAIAIPVGLFLAFLIPWPENTVRRSTVGGGEMEITMRTFQHPVAAALGLALLLPVVRIGYRSWRSRQKGVVAA